MHSKYMHNGTLLLERPEGTIPGDGDEVIIDGVTYHALGYAWNFFEDHTKDFVTIKLLTPAEHTALDDFD